MSRSVEEWIGKTDDSAVPLRVQARVIMRHNAICPECNRPLRPMHIAIDHIVALVNGGENRESNLQPLCVSPCHLKKTIADVGIKSKIARTRSRHLGIRKSRVSFQTNKLGPLKKKISGEVVRR